MRVRLIAALALWLATLGTACSPERPPVVIEDGDNNSVEPVAATKPGGEDTGPPEPPEEPKVPDPGGGDA